MKPAQSEESNIGISGLRKLNRITTQMYGFDLRTFATTSLLRKIESIIQANHFKDVDTLIHVLETRSSFFPIFQSQLNYLCSELFRDPAFWKLFRDSVVPVLNKTKSKIRIWVHGCSSGEEVLSTAIVLHESGLNEKFFIYATGINELSINEARNKIYFDKQLEVSDNNYKRFCNDENSSIFRYLERKEKGFIFKDEFYKNIRHEVFNGIEANEIRGLHLVLCRNYFIYCTPEYQNNLLGLFTKSLIPGGFLAIGNKENISFCNDFNKYVVFNKNEKVFQKKTY